MGKTAMEKVKLELKGLTVELTLETLLKDCGNSLKRVRRARGVNSFR